MIKKGFFIVKMYKTGKGTSVIILMYNGCKMVNCANFAV